MYKLSWGNDESIETIGIFNSYAEAHQNILDWWESNNFEPRYIRLIGSQDSCMTIDYGSHRNFYYIECVEVS